MATLVGPRPGITPASLVDAVELIRIDATRRLDPERQARLGQFLTPAPVAQLMAQMFELRRPTMGLLDPGAGIGSLSAALIAELCRRSQHPQRIELVAFEVDECLLGYLRQTVVLCKEACHSAGVDFTATICGEDFLRVGADVLAGGLFNARVLPDLHAAILNPPYKKIHTDSEARHLLRRVGMETSNLYTAFVTVAGKLLKDGGELVAITPRSFCNGTYFRPFRKWLLRDLPVRRFYLFESRTSAFRDDGVLQENVIFHAVRSVELPRTVTVSCGEDPNDDAHTERLVSYEQLVNPADPEQVIHLVADDLGQQIARRMAVFDQTLDQLGVTVSTGRVVDFRARTYLRASMNSDTVPLVYPSHFDSGYVRWPRTTGRKPNALAIDNYTRPQTVPHGLYVLTKRFSAKEERRRIVAAIYDPDRVGWSGSVAFENHLNYFHEDGRGLPSGLARGLTAFLNSTLVDAFFRQFNGHTQVNAGDLRRLRYPDRAWLERLARRLGDEVMHQEIIDRAIEEEISGMSPADGVDPVLARRRIDEALAILTALGFPRQQRQERSALTLLALAGIRPEVTWAEAEATLIGITPMMEFFRDQYGKTYAPNSRETVRRQTVHQFVQAGLVVQNPDNPQRPTNSGQTAYQLNRSALELLRTYGTPKWKRRLKAYLSVRGTLAARYAAEREMKRIPVTLKGGATLTLSPGGQNILVEQIINEFCERFTPGADLLYVGDTGEKWAYFDRQMMASLGITIEEHGKMPDVIVRHRDEGWLVLIEAVTSHGPVNAKRREELTSLFAGATVGLVFVTAFLTRQAMVKYLSDIAWETEVWVAESPSHLIHFNGERFLGPY